MSLGLGDLNKKRRQVKVAKKSETPATSKRATTAPAPLVNEPAPKASGAARVRSRTARPWSQGGLSRGPSGRRSTVATDASMNDEWASVHAEPLFWLDPAQNSKLAYIQEKLTALEERIQQAVCKPLRMIQRICF